MKIKCFLIIFAIVLIECAGKKGKKKIKPVEEKQLSPSKDNPDFIRDRQRNIISKPDMPPTWASKYRQKYDPAWMDYCDPYHCNDYHRIVCGLNRRKMRFKWFQSTCHLILNNQCADYRGFLRYDMIENQYCSVYVMFLRAGCPRISNCHDDFEPICAMSSVDGHVVLFKNQCFMDAVNCRNSTFDEYDAVYMDTCQKPLIDTKTENNKKIMSFISTLIN